MTNIDYNAIIAFATAAIAFFAILGLIISLKFSRSESKRARFSMGIDLILRLDNYFNRAEFRKIRNKAAKLLLSEGLHEGAEMVPLDEVLNFFEMVALLTLRDALNDDVAWNIFFYYMHRYKLCAEDRIDTQRKKDTTVWEHFIEVYERLKEVEKSKRGLSDKNLSLSNKERKDFLKEESVR